MTTRGKQEPTLNDIAYLAGMVDADGCISISVWPAQGNRSDRFVLEVTIVNTSVTLMEWLVEKFGGRYKNRKRVSEKHKLTYDWKYTNSKAVEILKLILPYLVAKKDQALNGIEFVEGNTHKLGGQGAMLTPEEIERRWNHYTKQKQLNKFGPCSRND